MLDVIIHRLRTQSPAGASPARRLTALFALSLTFGLVQLDATIVNVALDAIRRDLGGGIAAAQWIVTGYAVPFAAGMLTAGAIGDRFGHRLCCLAGFVVFGLASGLAAVAGGWAVLILARVLQGVGAAAMLPSSLAMIGRLYPEPAARARALGIWGGIATAGFATGPVLGGLLITHQGWPAIFLINLPTAMLIGAGVALTGPVDVPGRRRIDPVGTVLGMITLGALAAAIIEAGQRTPASELIATGLLALAVGSGWLFVLSQRGSAAPLLQPGLVASPQFRWALITGCCFNAAMYGSLLCVSLTLQAGYGYSALAAGLAVLPMAVVVSIGATGSGFLTARWGPRRPMIVGFVSAGAGASLMAAGAWSGAPGLIIIGLTVSGLCSVAMPAMTAVALNAAPAGFAGLVGGALNTARQLGGAVGVALLGALVNAGGFGPGGTVAFLAAALVCGCALLGTVRATPEEAERSS